MTEERWQDLKQRLTTLGTILETYEEDLNPGTAEVIEFEGPQGILKISYHRKPKVLDKKTSYSNRVGSAVSVSYTYSKDEQVRFVKVERWDEAKEEWRPVQGSGIF